jgi:hypothetical protein
VAGAQPRAWKERPIPARPAATSSKEAVGTVTNRVAQPPPVVHAAVRALVLSDHWGGTVRFVVLPLVRRIR